jgi:hypothetical protein
MRYLKNVIGHRFGMVILTLLLVVGLSFLVRVILFIFSFKEIPLKLVNIQKAIAWYQGAYYLYKNGFYKMN